jgi:PAS domain-containing protein
MKNIEDGILITERDRIVLLNPAAERIFGVPKSRVGGILSLKLPKTLKGRSGQAHPDGNRVGRFISV